LIFIGCATGSHTITGNARPAIISDGVKIYTTMPEQAETIGLLTAENSLKWGQAGMESVLKKLKSKAAAPGANGVVITSQSQSATFGTIISGTAIFVC
jgi:hypothetical protein